MHTLLLNGPMGSESLKYFYTVPMIASELAHTEAFNSNQAVGENINNMYELPSLACTSRYLHVAAGFLTKATCLKSIMNGKYLTWILITIHDVNRNLPESDDTQKGHIWNKRQGVQSTKAKAPYPGTESPPAEEKRHVFINVYSPKRTMYTDQTVNSPHRSIQGNR